MPDIFNAGYITADEQGLEVTGYGRSHRKNPLRKRGTSQPKQAWF
jgi:hypothetical protein